MSKKLQSEVGDKRIVRSDLVHDEYYGDEVNFDEGMKKFLSQEVIISEIYFNYCSVENGNGWSFSEEMFEPIEPKDSNQTTEAHSMSSKEENYLLMCYDICMKANESLSGDSITKDYYIEFTVVGCNEVFKLTNGYDSITLWRADLHDPINSFEDFSEMMYGRINELKSQLSQVYRLTDWRK